MDDFLKNFVSKWFIMLAWFAKHTI